VANVEMGANMILTPGEQIAQRIYEALPYVDEVDVQKQFPTTINLKITETQAAMVLQGTASAWLLDAKGKLLEPVSDGTDVSGFKSRGWSCWNPSRASRPRPPRKTRAGWMAWWA